MNAISEIIKLFFFAAYEAAWTNVPCTDPNFDNLMEFDAYLGLHDLNF